MLGRFTKVRNSSVFMGRVMLSSDAPGSIERIPEFQLLVWHQSDRILLNFTARNGHA